MKPAAHGQILPGNIAWDTFLDKQVQEILGKEFIAEADAKRQAEKDLLQIHGLEKITGDYRELADQRTLHVLASPIMAWSVADSIADNRHTLMPAWLARRFASAYRENPVLMADLLKAVTNYHALPESEWSEDRRLFWIKSTASGSDDSARARMLGEETPDPRWKELGDLPGIESLTESQMKMRYSRERSRRQAIFDHWSASICAWNKVESSFPDEGWQVSRY